MKRYFAIFFSILICLSLLLTGCTQKANYEPIDDFADKPGSSYYAENSMELPAPGESKTGADQTVLAGRKVIRNASLTVQTLEFDLFMKTLIERVNALGGYVEKNSVDGNDYNYSSARMRSASTVVRIPAEKLDGFLTAVDELGNVTRREENLSDVTETYVDMEAKLASLRTEYDALLELLSQADSLEVIIQLQDRLSDVRYEMESYEARLHSYDNLIEFSTVSLSIYEVARETPVDEETFGEEVSRRFHESLEDVGDGFTSFAKWFIGNLPHIVVTLAFLLLPLVIVFICIKSARRRRAKRMKKVAEAAAAAPAPAAEEKKE